MNGLESRPGIGTPLYRALIRKIWFQLLVGLGLIALWVLFEIADNRILDARHRAFNLTMKTLQVAFILNAAWAVNRMISVLKSRGFPPRRMPAGMRTIVYLIARITAFSIAILIALDTIGISITPLIASLGVGSLAVALALQDTLGNLFSGFYMNLDRPISPGDWIELENKTRGQVLFIGWRTTRILLPDGNTLIIPNSKLASAPVINFTVAGNEISGRVDVGVGYGSDLERTEAIAVEVAVAVLKTVPGGVFDPPPVARFLKFADSAIEMGIFFKVKNYGDQYLATHQIMKALKKRFESEGIEIPFPQRVIRMQESVDA